MDWFLQIAKEYGIFAGIMLLALYKYDKLVQKVQTDAKEREDKYLIVIQTLSDEVKERLSKLEALIRRKKDE
jgi:hypothetical protein